MIFGSLVFPDLTFSSAFSICSFVHCFLLILFEGDWSTGGADLDRFRFLLVRIFRCPQSGIILALAKPT